MREHIPKFLALAAIIFLARFVFPTVVNSMVDMARPLVVEGN